VLGCWQLLDESVRSQFEMAEDGTIPAPRPQQRVTGTRVCVARADKGVTITTIVGTQKALEETVVADGVAYPMADAECKGSKQSEWSTIGERLYTTAEITCGTQPQRKISSLAIFSPGPTWTDIQVIDISGRKNVRIRKYQRAADQAGVQRSSSMPPFAGEMPWTVADVKEASAKLMPEAVQAALVELDAKFKLTGKQLIDMDKAGVPDNTIDLMVALSYPKKFIVERPVNSAPTPYGMYGDLGYPIDWADTLPSMWADSMYLRDRYWSDYGFWPAYYSPLSYRYWGRYDPYGYPSSGYVVIGAPPTGITGNDTPVASGVGRVVDGRGYTRITTRAPEPSRINSDFGGSNGTTSSSGSSGGNSSGGSSGVSSGGYSSGGGGDTGRTAVPRGPGGN
jgi:hypothetical protein